MRGSERLKLAGTLGWGGGGKGSGQVRGHTYGRSGCWHWSRGWTHLVLVRVSHCGGRERQVLSQVTHIQHQYIILFFIHTHIPSTLTHQHPYMYTNYLFILTPYTIHSYSSIPIPTYNPFIHPHQLTIHASSSTLIPYKQSTLTYLQQHSIHPCSSTPTLIHTYLIHIHTYSHSTSSLLTLIYTH